MHELSIARQLVRVADEAARAEGASRVTVVHLRLGALAGVVREALDFAWEFATERTLLAGARLAIEDVPVTARCEPCAADVVHADPTRLRCPRCDAPTPQLLSGRELELRAIEFDRAPASPAPASPSHTGPASAGAAAPTRS